MDAHVGLVAAAGVLIDVDGGDPLAQVHRDRRCRREGHVGPQTLTDAVGVR
jgi:hypothetical protein